MADFMKVDFLDAGEFIATDGCDGIHFTGQNNLDLGKAIAAKVKELFQRGRRAAVQPTRWSATAHPADRSGPLYGLAK
ncbi:hypothetical protein ABUE31_18125 [Mesorhizobium sp. ZMM04-5]|uniref:Sialate O-acetylesterase domain-containing protein n=1 Tax=Mesorhizobium marinum TaxID=3228790 RepID=A0ABV3R3J7_9HYPH